MSKPKYPWWDYVKSIVEHHEGQLARIRAWDSTLTKAELQAGIAVEWAKCRTLLDCPEDGEQRLDLIRAAYWDDEPRNLEKAAELLGIPWTTAKRWHKEFILLVAQPFGMLD